MTGSAEERLSIESDGAVLDADHFFFGRDGELARRAVALLDDAR